MPKKILFESAIHQFSYAGKRLLNSAISPIDKAKVDAFLASTDFEYQGAGLMTVKWTTPQPGQYALSFKDAQFYVRGDTPAFNKRQEELHLKELPEDQIMANNEKLFDGYLLTCLKEAGVTIGS